ncbi:hypothetical protein [Pseudoalteromonas ardens]|uniref:Uncharacterized protein n=1 Tax=Pseudoalteromonas rubra TaxID=43658 RepID=A0A0L0EP20_9GAMM|nr:hypothetical protein [Pseudoalteromonas sp. R96]KNC66141.1 hypothetical protein AC626_18810 [Pseudoalteromonas rubra]MDK1312865.1 hypothetical protein [Pseudoalteromonas sp. R96]
MRYSKTLIALSISLVLSACGSSNKTEPSIDVPIVPGKKVLTLVTPESDATLVEDLPISLYVDYPEGEQTIDAVTSIDLNGSELHILQAGKEYGYIKIAPEGQSYHASPLNNNDANAATDLERLDNLIWFISADNTLHQFNLDDNSSQSWALADDKILTELALDEENPNHVWLYDQANHELVYFNATDETSTEFKLVGEHAITGVALAEEQLLILANSNEDYMVMVYDAQGTEVEHTQSWYLSGFAGQQFNDLELEPEEGRIVLSTPDTENNITLVADKNAMLGDGPLEDDTELEPVKQFDLDDTIAQPSGLWSQQDGSWLLLTDQAEVFFLDSDFKLVERHKIEFNSLNCSQGCTEAVVGVADGFYVLADTGLVGHFNKTDDGYQLSKEFRLNITDENDHPYSYSGLGYDGTTGDFFTVPDQLGEDEQDVLLILNSDFTLKEKHSIGYTGEADGSINEYDAQGVSYSDGFVYVVSEKFTKVLKLNLSGEIVEVIELDSEDVFEPSDIVVRDDQFYITGDHENDQPVPPITQFNIEKE